MTRISKALKYPGLRALLLSCAGTIGVGVSMAIMNCANVGCDAVTMLISGVADAANISLGVASSLTNLLFFIFAIMMNRQCIGWATLIAVLLMGPCMDAVGGALVLLVGESVGTFERYSLMLMSAALMGASIGVYLSLDIGSSPSDGMILWLMRATRLRFRLCSWLFFGLCFLGGMALGEPPRWETLLILLIVGWVSDLVFARRACHQAKWHKTIEE